MLKKLIAMFFVALLAIEHGYAVENYPHANQWTILLARSLSKDIFELNGVPYLQPLVEVVNATANSRFFSSAYIPSGKNNFYIKLGVNGMLGFVPSNKKEYHPALPIQPYDPNNTVDLIQKLAPYLNVDLSTFPPLVTVKDTAGLIYYTFRMLMYDGVQKGKITPPATAPTILGQGKKTLDIPHQTVRSLLDENPIFALLPQTLKDTIYKSIENFPEHFDLPAGLNINRVIAGIPQLEIGSLYGTELTLRFIPKINLGKNIGYFSFWGIGIRHSLSQYITEPSADFTFQIAYQGTNLQNTIGVTNAQLNANANFFNANLHFSKRVSNVFELYSGLSYEHININTDFTYYLPITVQFQLGLIWLDDNGTPNDPSDDFFRKNPDLGYNGDPYGAMVKNVVLSDNNFKFTLGVVANFGNFATCLDYNFGKVDILSLGLVYRFDIESKKWR
jgi:hypothetical protein